MTTRGGARTRGRGRSAYSVPIYVHADQFLLGSDYTDLRGGKGKARRGRGLFRRRRGRGTRGGGGRGGRGLRACAGAHLRVHGASGPLYCANTVYSPQICEAETKRHGEVGANHPGGGGAWCRRQGAGRGEGGRAGVRARPHLRVNADGHPVHRANTVFEAEKGRAN